MGDVLNASLSEIGSGIKQEWPKNKKGKTV